VSEGSVAIFCKIGGQLVFDDPIALAAFQAEGKHKCRNTLKINSDRVEYFKRRLEKRGLTAFNAVIVIVNVDDVHGAPLTEILMPGTNWQGIRDRVARGLATRDGIQQALDIFDRQAAEKLQTMTDVAVVVIDHGVAEVFPA
jgi:hypothetical protein